MSYYFASQKVKDDTNLFHLPVKDIDFLITGKKLHISVNGLNTIQMINK